MIVVSSTVLVLAYIFLAVAVVATVAAVASISYSVASTRKDRLARHESIRSYYGRLSLSH